jgi:hypothetical protein
MIDRDVTDAERIHSIAKQLLNHMVNQDGLSHSPRAHEEDCAPHLRFLDQGIQEIKVRTARKSPIVVVDVVGVVPPDVLRLQSSEYLLDGDVLHASTVPLAPFKINAVILI